MNAPADGGVLMALLCVSALACSSRDNSRQVGPGVQAMQSTKSRPSRAPTPLVHATASSSGNAPPTLPGFKISCKEGMNAVRGGSFWAGSAASISAEESPRFKSDVPSFCIDATEVTVTAYAGCVGRGACKPARADRRTCNGGRADRAGHPANCLDWYQARAYCAWRMARLPSELEWEYAARGGAEYRTYSWGNSLPDGRACWKQAGGTCRVRSFAAGAFGLYDMTGNVWEWTGDWFGPYPRPPMSGSAKAYRGGGWSRRFEKWLRTRLRNRDRPEAWGSHLGFRCAATPAGVGCALGAGEGGACLPGVIEVQCESPQIWNGSRCGGRVHEPTPSTVARTRSSEFDLDCLAFHPERPRAFRFGGGSHADRNLASQSAACKSRDVGVGWNSSCCP